MNRDELLLRGADDFVRLDSLCSDLLQEFAAWLRDHQGRTPLEAGGLAHQADRYLRDFVVDCKETGPADEDPTLVRQYLANWYIVHTLYPTHDEIDRIREALVLLYRFLMDRGVVGEAACRAAEAALADAGYFHARLEAFWNLTPEEIDPWRAQDDYRRRRQG
ncbi:hypothetical protein [Deferrisoma camini]|uniref:hypothetical protein n=1 Tax=Deferrisoma camini TaxID=1035120 RepID=UPI00046D080D|nr:hypothetical protein [Deferrisoma camini]